MTAPIGTYRYTQKDLLAERYHYQYTPYEGSDFLRAYLAQRGELVERLRVARKQLLARPSEETMLAEEIREAILGESTSMGSTPLRHRGLEVLPGQPGDADFPTRSALLDLLQCHIYDPERATRLCPAWVNLFVRKFEVTKRLYVGYTSGLRPDGKEYHLSDNYALLGALLAFLYEDGANIKYLNSVLKLTDLLASMKSSLHSTLALLVSLVVAESELASARNLLADHQVLL